MYDYTSTASEPTAMTGTVSVLPTASPSSGSVTSSFDVRWASDAMPDYVFNVQYRFRGAGSSRWGSWRNQLSRTTLTGMGFVPDQGRGTYQFRAALRNDMTRRASRYSAAATISIT